MSRSRHRAGDPSGDAVVAIATLALLLPIVVALVRAQATGWWPEGDDANIALKAWDVFGGHPPLVGMRSTTGVVDSSLASHHPGPLEFYLLAPFVRLPFGGALGLLLGVATIAAASVVVLVRAARALGGVGLVVSTTLATLALMAVEGPTMLMRPLNTSVSTLPLVLLPLLATLLVRERLRWLPAYAVTASFVAQNQLAYAPLSAALTLALLVLALVRWRQRRRAFWPARGWRRPGAPTAPRLWWGTAALTLLLWLPPLVELLHHDPDNLQLLLRFAGASDDAAGAGPESTPLPAWFAGFVLGPHGSVFAGLLGLLTLAVLVLQVRRARRQGPPVVATLGVVLLGCSVVEVAVVARFLSQRLTPDYWLTPVRTLGVGVWALLLWQAGRWLVRHRGIGGRDSTTARVGRPVALVAAALLVATASVPITTQGRLGAEAAALVTRSAGPLLPQGARVRMLPSAGTAWISTQSAVAFALERMGHPTCLFSTWPHPEDWDHRLTGGCTREDPLVGLFTREADDMARNGPATVELGWVRVEPEGDFQVVVEPGGHR